LSNKAVKTKFGFNCIFSVFFFKILKSESKGEHHIS